MLLPPILEPIPIMPLTVDTGSLAVDDWRAQVEELLLSLGTEE